MDRHMQSNIVTLVISCLLTIGAQTIGANQSVAQNFRLATYNVNFANTRGDQVLEAIDKARPDVLCLQETTIQSEGWLQKQLTTSLPDFRSAGHNGKYYAERFSMASKFVPREIKYSPPEAGLFGFCTATYVINNRDVQILNVHLTPFGIPRGAGIVDAMHAISATEEQHQKEIDIILTSIDPKIPTLICGDFNSLSSFNAPKKLIEHGFIDSFASVHKDADQHVTWNWPSRPIPLKFRIDYIFHSSHFETVESVVVERKGSDHFLLVSELKFAE